MLGLALIALLGTPLAARSAAPHDREFWRQIISSGYALPAGQSAIDLIRELNGYLASPDPELRDEFAYSITTAWVYQKRLVSVENLGALESEWRGNLLKGIGERNSNGVLLRSFSALNLSVLAALDNTAPFLSDDDYHRLLGSAVGYLGAERDLRGHDQKAGWMHATAHTADLLKFLCRSPHLRIPTKTGSVIFRVTVSATSKSLAGARLSGRLVIFLSERAPTDVDPAFDPAAWVAVKQIDGMRAGDTIFVDADSLAAPRGFSAARGRTHWVRAVLDVDGDMGFRTYSAGDVFSAVTRVDSLGDAAHPTAIVLMGRVQPPAYTDTANVSVISLRSELLSRFHGRPVELHAAVYAPDGWTTGVRYRTVYHVPGWGATHEKIFIGGKNEVAEMRAGGERNTVHVYLDGSFPTGHHAFTNSDNNGPVGDALVTELIPYLESHFPLEARPEARFLTGHSSGGWATLSLQIHYPEFFGGTWSTSPDPVDFRDFVGIDLTVGGATNKYGPPGTDGWAEGHASALRELVISPTSGQDASFEAVFSPRNTDGRPRRLFDRTTGIIDSITRLAWQRYDLRATLAERWSTLEPTLRDKLHVFIGGSDTFHLDGSTRRLCEFFAQVHAKAECIVVPGRGHFDLMTPEPSLYPHGLLARIAAEMQALYDRRHPGD